MIALGYHDNNARMKLGNEGEDAEDYNHNGRYRSVRLTSKSENGQYLTSLKC